MKESDTNINEIIIRFLDGSITPTEKEELLDWIMDSDENKKEILRIYKSWNLSKAALSDFDDEKAFEQLGEKIGINKYTRKRLSFRKKIYLAAGAAACIVVLIMAIPFFSGSDEKESDVLSFVTQTSKPEITGTEAQLVLSDNKTLLLDERESSIHYEQSDIKINDEDAISKEESSKYNQLIIPFGKKSTITFSDGTKAWVNAGTRLVYPVEFSKKIREVYVDGEIYIDVVPDKKRPFVVKTKDLGITVLGTKFNVKAYESDQMKNITLISGSIRIKSGNNNESVLIPNQQYTYNENDGSNIIADVDASEYVLWTKGLYLFRSEKLLTITNYLSKYHGVNIECDKAASELKYSGKLDLENELPVIMHHITHSLPITFEQNTDKTYIIRMKK